MANIVVLGNCQARPLAELLKATCPKINLLGVGVVHLLRADQEKSYIETFQKADFIIAQQVADNYPCHFVRTGFLKGLFPGKVITWVNLYYSGYNPELYYIRLLNRKPLLGPMGEYHIKTIFNAWAQGEAEAECLRQCNDYGFNKDMYQGEAEKSLSELRTRESAAEIKIACFIQERLKVNRLFFTMNHPASMLIQETARQILSYMSYVSNVSNVGPRREPLNAFIPPVNCYARDTHGEDSDNSKSFKGVDMSCDESISAAASKRVVRIYTAAELIQEYFRLYRNNRAILKESGLVLPYGN